MKKEFLIKILIKGQQVELQLLRKKEFNVIDKMIWQEENNLSLKLLVNIDNILEKNRIKKGQLNNIEVDSDETTYSSTRIAKTVAGAGCYCLTN
jgi:hypothetical protein